MKRDSDIWLLLLLPKEPYIKHKKYGFAYAIILFDLILSCVFFLHESSGINAKCGISTKINIFYLSFGLYDSFNKVHILNMQLV